jgi:hypothetical protein
MRLVPLEESSKFEGPLQAAQQHHNSLAAPNLQKQIATDTMQSLPFGAI